MLLGVLAALLQDGCADQLAPGSSCGTAPAPVIPACGGFPGYSMTMTDCGGRQADGLRCVTGCTWQLVGGPAAEIADAGTITVDPGCTTSGADGGLVLCVFDCLACR